MENSKSTSAYPNMKTRIHETVEPVGVTVKSLHHLAHYCHDAEETRHFYEDLLGLRLVHTLIVKNLPGSGRYNPYVHLFFELEDGSSIAFFDTLGEPDHPGMAAEKPWTDHIALKLNDMEKLYQAKERLENAGVRVAGPIDHEFTQSIYFNDPNGVNLEFAVDSVDELYMQNEKDQAHQYLKQWIEKKKQHKGVKN
ncbi:hypothetical protein AMD27_05675 [Acinetobacter sp. TGL-Y2]|uniref:VOC family protein n=1 Tax=Acinetobacter sp. TGL-Y2 TaxID=1407071 RepID=UPI0007A64AE4|nr:VOC family protein [Acinetobacter sp. TGL-Y2]AMW78423.1 hypothetical protein AMD27_05675 [Acinetobacter sp. TGL-Y2]